jgi:hypothetical protein
MSFAHDLTAAMNELSAARIALGAESHTADGRVMDPMTAEGYAAGWRVDDARDALDALVRSGADQLEAKDRELKSIALAQGVLIARLHLTLTAANEMLQAQADESGTSVQNAALQVLESITRAALLAPTPLTDWYRSHT